jgi:hypothetical protein
VRGAIASITLTLSYQLDGAGQASQNLPSWWQVVAGLGPKITIMGRMRPSEHKYMTIPQLVIWLDSSEIRRSLIVQVFQILFNSRLNRKLHPPMLMRSGNDIIKNAHVLYIKKITIGHCKPTYAIIWIIFIIFAVNTVSPIPRGDLRVHNHFLWQNESPTKGILAIRPC